MNSSTLHRSIACTSSLASSIRFASLSCFILLIFDCASLSCAQHLSFPCYFNSEIDSPKTSASSFKQSTTYSNPDMQYYSELSMVLYGQAHPTNEPVPTLTPAPNYYFYPVHQQYSPAEYYSPQHYATVESNARLSAAFAQYVPAPDHHQVYHYSAQSPASVAPFTFTPHIPHRGDESREENHHHHHTEAHRGDKSREKAHHHHHGEAHYVHNRHSDRQSHNTNHRSSDTARATHGSVRQSSRPHHECRHEKGRESSSVKKYRRETRKAESTVEEWEMYR